MSFLPSHSTGRLELTGMNGVWVCARCFGAGRSFSS